MKRTLFRLFNLLMACVVLLSSTGFGLVEHTCQMRGKKKIVVTAFSDLRTGTAPGCAADQATGPTGKMVVKKDNCCQDEQSYENVDVSSSLSQHLAKFVKTVTETFVAGVVSVLSLLVHWIFDSAASVQSTFPSPPSPSGRDILTLVQSLLI